MAKIPQFSKHLIEFNNYTQVQKYIWILDKAPSMSHILVHQKEQRIPQTALKKFKWSKIDFKMHL